MVFPNLKEETKLWEKKVKRVVGLDEAGRGPLAGPVTAAAVMLRKISNSHGCKTASSKSYFQIPRELSEVKDSKKLTPEKRKKLFNILTKNNYLEWGIGKVSEKVIDRINIFEATKLAMKKALDQLKTKPDFLILDGNFKIESSISQKPIIKADEKVFSCSAASIIAKVTRDRIMERYHKEYPEYGFNRNKGYPTQFHFRMLKKYGPCKIHRKSFEPIRRLTIIS